MVASSILSIVLKISLGIFIFWALWLIGLRKVTRFGLVRSFIVGGTAIAAIAPLILPKIQHMLAIEQLNTVSLLTINIPEVIVGTTSNSISWTTIITVVFICISGVFALRFVHQIISLALMAAKGDKRKQANLTVVKHDKQIPPFSFFSYCFINPEGISAERLNEIYHHEQAHQSKGHSADIVLFELVGIVQWFNPFYWMLRKALVEVHEYQADRAVIDTTNDPHTYLNTIISIAFNGVALPIGNNFNKSLTIKRLAMMNITKKTKGTLTRLIVALAVAIPAIFAISCNEQEVEPIPNDESIVVFEAEENESPSKSVEGEIFVIVENMPKFNGKDINEFRNYISENIEYPQIAAENGIQGRVILSFVVTKEGKVTDVKILRGVDPSLDKEAIRVVESSPLWESGTQRGEKVNVSHNIPIIFSLK